MTIVERSRRTWAREAFAFGLPALVCSSLAGSPEAQAGPAKSAVTAPASPDAEKRANRSARRRQGDEVAPPATSYQIELEIRARESSIEVDRKRGIALLEEFIAKHADNRAMPEALYRLAALYWERGQERFIHQMEQYVDAVDRCKSSPEACPDGPPAEPQLDLTDSQGVYVRLLADHPTFRKIDTVEYLYAFSLRDQGRSDEAQALFWKLINEHPQSSFVPDSWMAIGDHRFYGANDFAGAREAYGKVLQHPHSSAYPMALFKTAWCHWKLGEREAALTRFKEVLDQAADPEQDAEGRKRLADLREEALEHLVLVLTEDESQTPADIYDFLASIGGEKYSRKVLIRLAEAYENQARYDKSVEGYRYVIALDPQHAQCAGFQVHVFNGVRGLNQTAEALGELRTLESVYAPGTAWGKAHPREAIAARSEGEQLLYDFSRAIHENAQAVEAATKVPDKERYTIVASAYADYIERFPANPRAVELSYLSGDVLFFKLERPGEAGHAYLRVGESAPVGSLHRDALLAAMAAYERAITSGQVPKADGATPLPSAAAGGAAAADPAATATSGAGAASTVPSAEARPPAGKDPAPATDESPSSQPPSEATPAPSYNAYERGFIRAADLFATLFPGDDEIGAVIYHLGEFFYGRDDFDAATQRFGKVVVDYPANENAAPAGDRILECLAKARDYDNIELWATKLKGAPSFAPKDEQQRLDRIIVDSLLKQGETLADRGYYERAASYFLRVPSEYPKHDLAPRALNNAGASLERAHRADAATATYERLARDYAGTPEAGEATLVVARVYENIAHYADAADQYDALVEGYPKHPARADALYNAGVLHQALGNSEEAVARYRRYAKEYTRRENAPEVALRIGQVYAAAGKHDEAVTAFRAFLHDHGSSDRTVEANTRLGNSLLQGGKGKEAAKAFEKAAKSGRSAEGTARLFAAEGRFREGDLLHARFEAATLDPRSSKLAASLKKKAELLAAAKDVYLDVIAYNAPEWSTAALLRVGDSYESFARGLREYPIPEGLSDAELEAYSEQLDTFALAFEEQAIEAYKSGYAKALQLGIYNVHTREIRAALGRLSAQEYPPIHEIGADTVVAGGGARSGRPIRRLGR